MFYNFPRVGKRKETLFLISIKSKNLLIGLNFIDFTRNVFFKRSSNGIRIDVTIHPPKMKIPARSDLCGEDKSA